MANWCSTIFYIYSKDEVYLQSCADKLSSQFSGESVDFEDFLKNNKIEFELCNCGYFNGVSGITKLDNGFNYFLLYSESKWVPCYAVVGKFMDKYFPYADVAYVGEELGCNVYVKYDPDNIISDNFIVSNGDNEYFDTSHEVVDYLLESYNITLASAIDYVKQYHADELGTMTIFDVITTYLEETRPDGYYGLCIYKVEKISDPYEFDR